MRHEPKAGVCPSCKREAVIGRDLKGRVHTITCEWCGVFTVCSWCHTLARHETPDGNILRLNDHGRRCRSTPPGTAPRRGAREGSTD